MKNRRGITLISLVITIVVLVILSVVAINLTLGKNGIITKARQTKQNHEAASNKEQTDLDELYGQLLLASDGTINNMSLETLNNLIETKVREMSTGSSSGDGVPAGTVISYITGNNAPNGYLKCDGTVYNISDYKSLADAIKNGLGSYDYYGGNGTTTFAVPDLRGEFLRGYSPISDSSINVGAETAEIGKHQNPTKLPYIYNYGINNGSDGWIAGPCNGYGEAENVDTTIGSVTRLIYSQNGGHYASSTIPISYTVRPTNTSVLYCIKY